MNGLLVVGISDYIVSKSPAVLATYALGSCVGICLYDSTVKIGGLSHIMLPDSSMFPRDSNNRMKYADTAIVDMAEELTRKGADRRRLIAKIAGGAKMFEVHRGSQIGSIGDRNVDSVKMVLKSLKIPLVSEDTRKNYGRTVFFDLSTGVMKIQSLSKSTVEI